jgi:hypothetical protein
MRLYKISALNTSQGEQPDSETHWVGSLADASAKRKQLAAEGWARKEVETVKVDVPTYKAGLIRFLNLNVQ